MPSFNGSTIMIYTLKLLNVEMIGAEIKLSNKNSMNHFSQLQFLVQIRVA